MLLVQRWTPSFPQSILARHAADFAVDFWDRVSNLRQMLGFFGRRSKASELERLQSRIAERESRLRDLKDKLAAARLQRDAARERVDSLARELAEESTRRHNAEARMARLVEDLRVSEANPLPSGLPWALPPIELRSRVAGYWSGHQFLRKGASLAANVRTVLDGAGVDRTAFRAVLDWGCGCGRVFRHLPAVFPGAILTGADIDRDAIAWNRQHLSALGSFHVVPDMPPSTLPARAFDFILGISVFTHLPARFETAWLHELARLAAPGATLLLSYHGDELIAEHFTLDQAIENQDGFSYFRTSPTPGLPDHYQVSYHSEAALRRMWGAHFDVISIHPRSLDQRQGFVLCRARHAEQ